MQQIASVAYACNLAEATRSSVAAMTASAMPDMPGCEGMKSPPPSPLCEKHCHPDPQTASDVRVPPVPPALAPALLVDFDRILQAPEASRSGWQRLPEHPTDPPPRRRFGVLLI